MAEPILIGNFRGPQGEPGENGRNFDVNEIDIGVVNMLDITKFTRRGDVTPITDFDIENGIVRYADLPWYLYTYEELRDTVYSLRIKDYVSNPDYNSGRVQIIFYEVIDGVDGGAVLTQNVERDTIYSIDLSDRPTQTYRIEIRISNTTPYTGYIEKPMLVEGNYPVVWNYKDKSYKKDTVVLNVPEQFNTLQKAFDHAIAMESTNQPVDILMSRDFKPSSGIIMSNVDASNITIKSLDSTVTVGSDFTGDFISGSYSKLPTLDALIDMNNVGGNGITCEKGSSGKTNYYKGIKNAGGRGLYLSENSKMYARYSIFNGCHDRNVWVTRTSTFEGENGDFSANQGGENAVYISRASTGNLLNANVSNAFSNGLAVIRSFVNAENIDVSGAGATGIVVQRGSHVISEFASAENCTVNGVRVEHGSWLSGREMNTSSSGAEGIYVLQGSKASIYGSTSTNGGSTGLRVSHGSEVNATDCTLTGNTGNDIRCTQGSTVQAFGNAMFNISNCYPNVANSLTNNGIIFSE